MSYGKMGAQLHEPSDEHAYEFEQHMEENRTEDEPRDQQDDEGNEAVSELMCEECGHAVRLHHADYGCEYELGDKEFTDARGFNYLAAAGPCGCKEWAVEN